MSRHQKQVLQYDPTRADGLTRFQVQVTGWASFKGKVVSQSCH